MDTGGRSLPGHMALGTPIGNLNRNSSLLNTERREKMCVEAGSQGRAAESAGPATGTGPASRAPLAGGQPAASVRAVGPGWDGWDADIGGRGQITGTVPTVHIILRTGVVINSKPGPLVVVAIPSILSIS